MATQSDLDLLKDIPGYKAILKSVLKSQIQLLIEQLADHTGEESIILTASVHDGALSHLGSSTGKGFMEGRDEIKSQFLGYCLNSHHRKRSEHNSSPYHREKTIMPAHSSKRPRIRKMPYSMSPSVPHSQITSPTSVARSSTTDVNTFSQNSGMHLSMDSTSQSDIYLEDASVSDSLQMSHTIGQSEETVGDLGQQEAAEENGTIPLVKKEPEMENDEDIVLTGVEIGENSQSSDNWSQGYGSKNGDNAGGNQSGYNSSEQAQNDGPVKSEPLGGIAFPGLDNVRHDYTTASTNHFQDISPTELKLALYPEGNELGTSLTDIFPKNSPKRGNTYWCNACKKHLQNRTLYEYHVRAHSGVKPYACQICNRTFAGKQVLETHLRLHSGEKPFKCDVAGCDRAFVARSGLFYHLKKHHPKQ